MKLKFKAALVILTGVVFFYTACKKTNQSPSNDGTVSLTVVSSQIAENIAQSLSGAYGGVNISNGLILPGFTTKFSASVSIGADLFDLCSFAPDTVLSYSTNIGDTIKSTTKGIFRFYFSCDTLKAPKINGYSDYSLLNGYNAYDSLLTTGIAPRDSFIYNIKASYNVKALDTVNIPLIINGSSNKLLSVNGGLKSFVDAKAINKTVASASVHAFYNLTGVTVDLTKNGDVTSGTATFNATGSYNNVAWSNKGTVTFLGNNKANITIGTKTYNANLLTGIVTASN